LTLEFKLNSADKIIVNDSGEATVIRPVVFYLCRCRGCNDACKYLSRRLLCHYCNKYCSQKDPNGKDGIHTGPRRDLSA
jgi:hypothetical protein